MFTITTPAMPSFETLERVRAVRLATAKIWVPGDDPPPPRRAARPAASPRPAVATSSPVARAYRAGIGEAHANALAAIAVCNEFGRPDLLHQVVGLSPAAARQYVIDRMWSQAFAKARATPRWMVR